MVLGLGIYKKVFLMFTISRIEQEIVIMEHIDLSAKTLAELESLEQQYRRNRLPDTLSKDAYYKRLTKQIKRRKDKMDGDSVYA